MSKILVTGAAGFIGMHTSIRFLNEGWAVVGLDNFNDYYSVTLKRDRVKNIQSLAESMDANFKMITDDLNSNVWESLKTENFDAVVHLAAQAGVRYSIENPRAYLESNVLGFQSVLEFVSKTGIQRFVYASSSSVYGNASTQPFVENQPCNQPESYYAATKIMNELMAKSYFKTQGLCSIGLRFFTVYGPWGRPDMAPMLFAKAAMDNSEIRVFNHGNQQRDFTYVDDIVEGIYRVIGIRNISQGALVLNIGRGAPVSLMKFIDTLEKRMNREIRKSYVEAQLGDVKSTYACTKLLSNMINYSPKVSLDLGINTFVDWYKRYYKHK
jgi:UDP-glucuronate 4-epimerase